MAGCIRFAGSERADRGLHWMEGAVRRGNVVASEVLAILSPKFDINTYWVSISLL